MSTSVCFSESSSSAAYEARSRRDRRTKPSAYPNLSSIAAVGSQFTTSSSKKASSYSDNDSVSHSREIWKTRRVNPKRKPTSEEFSSQELATILSGVGAAFKDSSHSDANGAFSSIGYPSFTALKHSYVQSLSTKPKPAYGLLSSLLNEPDPSTEGVEMNAIGDQFNGHYPLDQVSPPTSTAYPPRSLLLWSEPDTPTPQASIQEYWATDSIPQSHDPTPYKPTRNKIKTCYILIFLGLTTVVGSLVPSLVLYTVHHDLQGGFTLGQYILGVGIFIVGSVAAIHSRTCTCWHRAAAYPRGR